MGADASRFVRLQSSIYRHDRASGMSKQYPMVQQHMECDACFSVKLGDLKSKKQRVDSKTVKYLPINDMYLWTTGST